MRVPEAPLASLSTPATAALKDWSSIGSSAREIIIGAGSNNVIEGNIIGTDIAGSAARPNTSDGIFVLGGTTNNTIGGSTAAARNLISGNNGNGISFRDPGTSNNVVQGNFLGADVNGSSALPNQSSGIVFGNQTANTTVGGTTAGARNIISGNGQNGITIGVFGGGPASAITIQGNTSART